MKTPNSLKLIVTADRSMSGKPTGKHIAKLAGFTVTDAGKDKAVESLERSLADVERHQFTRRYLVTSGGTVFALWHAFETWGYDIIHTDKMGAQSPGSCMLGNVSQVDAYTSMKNHWEQMEEQHAVKAA